MPTSKGWEAPLLLDTHVWIWLMNADKALDNSHFLTVIQKKAQSDNIWVSVISVWELAMLESKGRISLPYSCYEWVNRALNAPGISLAPLTPEIAIESSRLPGSFHGDPADRILAATAKSLGACLATRDAEILRYCKTHKIGFLES